MEVVVKSPVTKCEDMRSRAEVAKENRNRKTTTNNNYCGSHKFKVYINVYMRIFNIYTQVASPKERI